MPRVEVTKEIRGLGEVLSSTSTLTNDGGTPRSASIAAGKAGTLSTRTDNETGTLTLGSGHGIGTGNVIDLYWATGARYGITVGTVSGTSVPIGADNAGTGDVLPAQDTAIVAYLPVTVTGSVKDTADIIAMKLAFENGATTAPGHVSFRDGSAASVGEVDLPANKVLDFDIAGGVTTPLSDVATQMYVSHGSSTDAATFTLIVLQDETP
jgi:hypothetical protein